MNVEPGSVVKVVTDEEELEGVLIPSDDKDYLVLKLDSGYNIGVSIERVEDVEVLEEPEGEVEPSFEVEEVDEDLPRISILHTGGTIASKVDYRTGAVDSKFSPEEILRLFPELQDIAQIDSRLISNTASELIRFDHHNLMARAVAEEREKGVDGVIITHGTDTMHYSSAALSFALENLDIPVVFVGSQRSSDRPSTDAYVNLISAARFIAETSFKGVGVCMHEGMSDDTCLVLPGLKCRKMHTSRRDAFKPVNSDPIARVDAERGEVELLGGYEEKNVEEDLEVHEFDPDVQVGWLKCHPNMFGVEFENYEGFDGLLLELTGLGHAPNMVEDEYMQEHNIIEERIEELCEEMPVVASSQCLYGRVNMNVYSPGRELKFDGVVGDHLDITPETAFVKLAWLLSNFEDRVRELFCENLRGEVSSRSEEDDYL